MGEKQQKALDKRAARLRDNLKRRTKPKKAQAGKDTLQDKQEGEHDGRE